MQNGGHIDERTQPGRLFYLTIALGIASGALIVALAEIVDVPRGVKDAGLVVGGALIGLLSLWLDEVLRARPARRQSEYEREQLLGQIGFMSDVIMKHEHREMLKSQTQTDNAYYLGFVASTMPLAKRPIDDGLGLIMEFCADLGLQFSAEDQQMLGSPSEDHDRAEKVSQMLLNKGKALGPEVRCFFQLGNTLAWLSDELRQWHRTHPVLKKLEALDANPFVREDRRYAEVVDQLVEILGPYRGAVTDDKREALKERVMVTLEKIPPVYVPGRDTRVATASTGWVWITSNGKMVPARILGRCTVIAQDASHYEVSQLDEPEDEVLVTRDESGWHCSAHAEASEDDPCWEMELVLDATDGGRPVTEAQLILVRSESVEPEGDESESQSDASP